eukprot:CAMPEP_0171316354 /NCGR_PEP_ID=MMETSP0816-20121228/72106_1 /TAXON_ID=420281 /ORGANISM="Proboscia inermis, Strain CCAP1064/1" /LENGTH=224 /DNA_ID=CAMNT_0011808217 /DNA_START=109 /DNA_END=783 /DNA_ORIENTATION=-
MSLLALSSIAFVLPTPFADYYDVEDHDVLVISRAAAIFLMFMYVLLLVFQLKTHKHIFEGEDEEPSSVPFYAGMICLTLITAVIAFLSDYLVQSLDGFTESSGISKTFVGIIILPVVGNAVEHITAVKVAMNDKMNLAMAVAIGSSVQIALFATPFTIFYGWYANVDMTINFPKFEVALYVMSIVVTFMVVSNGSGNWLLGGMLITTYLMIATGFWFEKVTTYV